MENLDATIVTGRRGDPDAGLNRPILRHLGHRRTLVLNTILLGCAMAGFRRTDGAKVSRFSDAGREAGSV